MNSVLVKLFSVLFLVISPSVFSQSKEIKEYYENAQKFTDGKPLKLSFVQEEMKLVENFEGLQQIMLIRHGEPALNKKGWRKRKGAQDFIKAYDTVGVYTPEHIPVMLYENEVKEIQTSSLERSKHTARILFGEGKTYVQDTIFREFERKIIGLPNIKLPLKFWLINSRIFWLLGMNKKGIESFSAAKKRTKRAVIKLEGLAEERGKVVLVSHGFLNRYLVKYLKKNGWEVAHDGGKGYLATWLLFKYE